MMITLPIDSYGFEVSTYFLPTAGSGDLHILDNSDDIVMLFGYPLVPEERNIGSAVSTQRSIRNETST